MRRSGNARYASRTAALTLAAPRAAAFAHPKAVSIRAALPKVAESARLALAGIPRAGCRPAGHGELRQHADLCVDRCARCRPMT